MEDNFSEPDDKGLRVDGDFGYRYLLIKQMSWVNYVSSRIGMRGWDKNDIQVFVNSVKTFRNLITSSFDDAYMNHEKEAFAELAELDIANHNQRQRIYELWSDLYADMVGLSVHRKKLIAKAFGTDDWSRP